MKKIAFLFIAVAILFVQCDPTKKVSKTPTKDSNSPTPVASTTTPTSGGLDRSIPPKAGKAPKIQIGEAETFTLSNGVEVFVVQNNKLPRVSYQLALDIDPIKEGEKAGLIGIAGQLMQRGTKTRNKQQIDEEMDFIGANLNTSGKGMFGSSLTKHQDKLLEMMSDVLLNATFPKEEFEKIKKQTKSGLAQQKDSPDAIASNVRSVLNFGQDHPYGELTTEETVENITVEDCKNYFDTYFKPNTTQLIVVGDVGNPAKLKEKLEKYFGDWKEGKVPTHEYKTPIAPKASEVAFVNKEGAVQSVISVTYPVNLIPGSKDAIAASVMNSILGGGVFSGYLMQNLREDKAYTYGARSSLRSDKLVGSFSAGASVRNEVTDSSITEILHEMNRIVNEKVDKEHLSMVLNSMTGNFSRSLESPQTVARFALNIERYNLPADYYQTYLEKLNAITPEDVQRVAKKYIRPEYAHILVVGNKEEVAPKLAKFSKSGKVNFYDTDGNPLEEEVKVAIPSGVTAQSIINRFVEVTGGKKWDKVKDYTAEMDIAAGPMSLAGTRKHKVGGKYLMEIAMQGNVVQKVVCDGERAVSSGMGGSNELKGDDLEATILEATINLEGQYEDLGYKMELKGMEKINDKDAYKVRLTSPKGKSFTEFYDKESGLKIRKVSVQEVPTQTGEKQQVTVINEIASYQTVDGLQFPKEMSMAQGPQKLKMTITSLKVNVGVKDSEFKVE